MNQKTWDRRGSLTVTKNEPSFIDETVYLGRNSEIGMFSYVERNVVIGDNVKIGPLCFIEEGTVIADNTIIKAGSIITKDNKKSKAKDKVLDKILGEK